MPNRWCGGRRLSIHQSRAVSDRSDPPADRAGAGGNEGSAAHRHRAGDRVVFHSEGAADRIGMVLTISSRKGGCGKTVLAMILAASLAEEGADVALLDTDPSQAARR
jgi:Mrp family chromosome partitioning ATPase